MKKILVTGAAGGIGTRLRKLLPGRLSGHPLERHPQARRSGGQMKNSWRPISPTWARSRKSSPASTASCISAAFRSKARGTPSTRPISSAATICSRRPTAPASSAWCSPPPITPSASIRASKRIGVDVTVRPDSRYGVSKAFGEALGALYADKHGLRVTCLRIGNFGDAPLDQRRLAIWLKPEDLVQLIRIGLEHPRHPVRDLLRRLRQRRWLVGQQQCAPLRLQAA